MLLSIRACSWGRRSWRRWEASSALVCWFCTSNPCPAARSWWLRQHSCWIWRRRSQTGHKGQWLLYAEGSAVGRELVGHVLGLNLQKWTLLMAEICILESNWNWDAIDSQRNYWNSGSMPCNHPCGEKGWKRSTCSLFSRFSIFLSKLLTGTWGWYCPRKIHQQETFSCSLSHGVLSSSEPPWRGSLIRKALSKCCTVGNKYCRL